MPNCRLCRAPIFFLTEAPRWYNAGTFNAPIQARADVKTVPIDVDPNPDGYIAIYESPPRGGVAPQFGRDFTGERKRYFRRIYGYCRESYIQTGGVMYSSHFDTCRVRRR